jgi:hypothetical protein
MKLKCNYWGIVVATNEPLKLYKLNYENES